MSNAPASAAAAAARAPLPAPRDPKLRQMADALRALAMDAVEKAKSGHPGMPMGMADIATVLFTRYLRFDPQAPDWPDRDRFVLSNGHGSMLLYGLLHLLGYPDMTMAEIERFRQLGSRTAGHPERGHASGIEVTTGPLGQGLGNSVGMALAERLLAAQFGDSVVDHHTYVFCGDGCLMEGISHEALSLAGHLRLSKLIVFYDDNAISIDGPTELAVSDDQVLRFRAHGWAAERIDGHDTDAIAAAIERAHQSDRPSLIACRTIIAFGAPTKAGTAAAHGTALGADEIKGARERLGWSSPPFVIPEEIRAEWRTAGARGASVRLAWEARLQALPAEPRAEFLRRQRRELPAGLDDAVATLCADFRKADARIATRQASGTVLDSLTRVVPELVGGSADLTPSNNTRAKDLKEVRPGDYSGRYIHYGVREHGMAAAMNGIAAHGGLIPYGGTFLTFSDYCRPSIRLSAFAKLGVVYVMTHDSIGLGEDGPTHQPVEHLAALRAIPGPLCLPPGRRGRDRRMLGLGPAPARGAVAARADPPGAAVAAPRAVLGKSFGARRLCAGRGRGRSPGHLARQRFGGVDRDGRARRPRQGRDSCRGGLDAVLGTVRGASPRNIATGCSAPPRGSGSRPRSNSAGTAGSARAALLSACTALARRPPARRSTRISGSPPKRLPRPPARFYRLAKACGRSEP